MAIGKEEMTRPIGVVIGLKDGNVSADGLSPEIVNRIIGRGNMTKERFLGLVEKLTKQQSKGRVSLKSDSD